MAIPTYQTCMLPLLDLCKDSQEHSMTELTDLLAKHFDLSEMERAELLPSGKQAIFNNRIGWARTYLKKAGLLSSPKRGVVSLTETGKKLLAENPERIDVKILNKFESFLEFRKINARDLPMAPLDLELNQLQTPQELLESSHLQLRAELADDLLRRIKEASPLFFERHVVNLLVAMGYGGSSKDAGRAVGRTGDGGIDGVIKEDRLGLDVIYIQAKRWTDGSVGRPEIQKFVGALAGHHAKKGVFITTSRFADNAREYAATVEAKVILIDGQELAQLMIDFNVGAISSQTYELKKIDEDYFLND